MTLKRLSPEFGFTPDQALAIVGHMVQLALAGLAAMAAGARRNARCRDISRP
jgi:hypothetical protein